MVVGVHPRIGITSTPATRTSVTLGIERPTVSLDRAYVEAVTVGGGAPLLVPTTEPTLADAVVAGLDGLVLSGGGDVDPASYGATPQAETAGVRPERDASELAVFDAARRRGLPVLAICRGMQVLNVAHGGTLLQHVPDVTHTEHLDVEHWDVSANPVTVQEGTQLHGIVGVSHLTVNSLHHQAVDQLGAGLRCTAVDEDGIIEGIEPIDGAPVIGVQWHPEMLTAEPAHQALFVWLVNRAAEVRDRVPSSISS